MSDDMDEPYENTLSQEELRHEVRRLRDTEHALVRALRDLREVPEYRVLLLLDRAAKWPDDNNVGKLMQREFGLVAIPPKSEAESGAGLWSHIRAGILAARAPTGKGADDGTA